MEDQWLTWAKRIQALASNGLYFSQDEYDRERYDELAAMANAMLSRLADVSVVRIEGLVSEFAQGYATPSVDVRGAVVRDGRVLLVREAAEGLWALPGGFAEVGSSPSENIAKEVWEEAGIRVEARALYAVRHKAKHAYDPDARDFYKLFFICDPLESAEPRPGAETSAVGFFSLENLPALSTDRVLPEDIAAAVAYVAGADERMTFD